MIREELQNRQQIARSYNNIGLVYQIKGEPDSAATYFKKSLDLCREIEDNITASESLRNLIFNAVHKRSVEDAKIYLSDLEEISDNINELL